MADEMIFEEKDEQKEKSKVVKYAGAAFEAAKKRGREAMERMRASRDPYEQLKEKFVEEKMSKRNQKLIRRRERMIAKYKREFENKMKRLQRTEENLSKGMDSAKKAESLALRAKLRETLKMVEQNIKKEQEEITKEEKKRRSPKQMEEELKKAREDFEKMPDEKKVEYAIKMDRTHKGQYREFLDKVVDNKEIKFNKTAQDMAANYLGRETEHAAQERVELNVMNVKGQEFAKGESTIKIGEKVADARANDLAGKKDARNSKMKTVESTKKHVQQQERDSFTRSR